MTEVITNEASQTADPSLLARVESAMHDAVEKVEQLIHPTTSATNEETPMTEPTNTQAPAETPATETPAAPTKPAPKPKPKDVAKDAAPAEAPAAPLTAEDVAKSLLPPPGVHPSVLEAAAAKAAE